MSSPIPSFLAGAAAANLTYAKPANVLVERRDTTHLRRAVVDYGVRAYYDILTGQEGKPASGNFAYLCWNHSEKSPSCHTMRDGGFYCYSCKQGGDAIAAMMQLRSLDFLEAVKEVEQIVGASVPRIAAPLEAKRDPLDAPAPQPLGEIDARSMQDLAVATESIFNAPDVLHKLMSNYGITADAIRSFNLGWSVRGKRLWIPVVEDDVVVNIRKHDIMRAHCVWPSDYGDTVIPNNGKPDWNPDRCKKLGRFGMKSYGIAGRNRNTLYPNKPIPGSYIVLTGGELKACLLNSNGISAVTFTGGEGSASKYLLRFFEGCVVDIAMDNDEAGNRAAESLAIKLSAIASKINIVQLPGDGDDVTDHYRKRGWDFSDWYDLPRREVTSYSAFGEQCVDVTFDKVHDIDLVGKSIRLNATIIGGYNTAFAVVSGCEAVCTDGAKQEYEECGQCSLPGLGFRRKLDIDTEDALVQIGTPSQKQLDSVMKRMKIPTECRRPALDIKRKRIMPIAIAPVIDGLSSDDSNNGDMRYFAHPVFYVGEDSPPVNEPVELTGKVIADPRDSRMTILSGQIRPLEKHETSASLHDDTRSYLASHAIDQIVDDLEVITGISGQRTMLKSYLLLFFMPAIFDMDGRQNGKHTAEVCVIGDPRQGKSTAMRKMQEHMRAGTFLSCKGATFAGLVGGLADFGARIGKMFSWGPLVLADGKLAFMDEFSSIVDNGTFAEMTSIRSDGIASRIVAGVNNRANARVRIAWAANPSGNRDLSKYDSTLAAIRELIKAPQDIARFEFFIGVHRNTAPEFLEKRDVEYTTAIASNHVRWAWAQKVSLSKEMSAFCDTYGGAVAKKYHGLPTLPATEARWKVARIACAFAMIRGTTDVEEVDCINAAMFLDEVYADGKTLDTISARKIEAAAVDSAIRALGGPVFARRMTRAGRKGIDRDSLMRMHTMSASYPGKPTFEAAMHELCDKSPAMISNKGTFYPTDEFVVMLEKIAEEA